MDVLRDEYRELYRHLQERFSAGDLAPGAGDTYDLHRRGEAWTLERMRLHRTILDEAKAECADLPRDGAAVLLTAGPPGAGKGTALQMLRDRQGDDTELGQALGRVHGADPGQYVVLDPDQFKEAIIRHRGGPTLPADAYQLPGGRHLAPAELASLLHRESSFLQDTFERWARSEGYNLPYDATMKNMDKTRALLGDLAREGYSARVTLSVEVPLQACLEQNALRWETGRGAFERGEDSYGGRMVPESFIRALYAHSADSDYSVSRANAERLHAEGMVTGLIELERGQWGSRPRPGSDAPAFQHQANEASGVRVSTAAARPENTEAKEALRVAGAGLAPIGRPRQPSTRSGPPAEPPKKPDLGREDGLDRYSATVALGVCAEW